MTVQRPAAGGPRVGVVVPAGGTARRLGGVDKPGLDIGGRSILERLVAELRPLPVVVVGVQPVGASWPGVVWCREDPPGGGPAAALAAGVRALAGFDVIVAVAGDQPFAASAVPRLLRALLDEPDAEAALGVDADDRVQPLLAAYRADALRERLRTPADGRSMRQLTAGLRVVRVALTGPEAIDVDDATDLAHARGTMFERRGSAMTEHLPEIYVSFRDRFPEVAARQDALAGAVDAAGPLEPKTVRLVKLGIAVGAQAEGSVKSNVRKALAAGATVAEIEQVILLGLTTRGFPAVVAAWQWMDDVVGGKP